MIRKVFMTFIIILLLTLISCSKSDQTSKIDDPKFDEDDFEILVSPNNQLAFKMLEHVEPNDENNIFVSPTSLFIALSMVYNGAEGSAKEEIASALQIETLEKTVLNKANAALISKLTKQSDEIELLFANSIWLNEKFHFQEQFSDDNEQYFDADISEIDILNPKSTDLINDWVSENTNGKINKIVSPPLKENLVTILINALYFNSDWKYEFDESLTEERPFTSSNGQSTDIPLMNLNEHLPYIENDVFQAVSLPYNEGEMSMDIYLPQENITIEELKDELTGGRWEDWNRQFEEKEGTILLPKFELEYETTLNEALQQLGMDTVFTEDAELPHMIVEDDPIWISKVRQKTYIDVHEKGTEAAAVTSVEIVTVSLVEDESFHMEVNRPFFFIIKDTETDMILFTGLIEQPII